MTKEQFEKLKPYEAQLRWAAKSSFVHMTNGMFNDIAALYAEIYGEGLTQSQRGCNTCRLKALTRLFNSYEEYMNELAEEQKAERAETQEVKKKPGRKKKIIAD